MRTTPSNDQAVLRIFYELIRDGHLCWGYNLDNWEAPFLHITDRGAQTLKNAGRDPANPSGYLEHLNRAGFSDPIAESYIKESINTYNNSCFKAAAVMVGAATERTVLALRDATVSAMNAKPMPVPKKLEDWRYKTVRDALTAEMGARKATMPKPLEESYSSFWMPLTEQPRIARNDAGHPVSIDPVTAETVHASLLIFPELVRLVVQLEPWLVANL